MKHRRPEKTKTNVTGRYMETHRVRSSVLLHPKTDFSFRTHFTKNTWDLQKEALQVCTPSPPSLSSDRPPPNSFTTANPGERELCSFSWVGKAEPWNDGKKMVGRSLRGKPLEGLGWGGGRDSGAHPSGVAASRANFNPWPSAPRIKLSSWIPLLEEQPGTLPLSSVYSDIPGNG